MKPRLPGTARSEGLSRKARIRRGFGLIIMMTLSTVISPVARTNGLFRARVPAIAAICVLGVKQRMLAALRLRTCVPLAD